MESERHIRRGEYALCYTSVCLRIAFYVNIIAIEILPVLEELLTLKDRDGTLKGG